MSTRSAGVAPRAISSDPRCVSVKRGSSAASKKKSHCIEPLRPKHLGKGESRFPAILIGGSPYPFTVPKKKAAQRGRLRDTRIDTANDLANRRPCESGSTLDSHERAIHGLEMAGLPGVKGVQNDKLSSVDLQDGGIDARSEFFDWQVAGEKVESVHGDFRMNPKELFGTDYFGLNVSLRDSRSLASGQCFLPQRSGDIEPGVGFEKPVDSHGPQGPGHRRYRANAANFCAPENPERLPAIVPAVS